MIRTVLAVAAAAAIATTAVVAQDVIAQRKALMKRSGEQARVGTQMVRGEAPFELAKAQAIFQAYVDKAGKLPELFPENSKTGGETTAAPTIWEKSAEFKALVAKFDAESKAALAGTTDEASFKTQFPAVQRNCGGCHETFRIRRS